MKNALIILAFLSICFASCKKDDGSTEEEPIVDGSIIVTTNINNDLLLKLVNDKRTAGCTCGTTVMPAVPALTWSNLLAASASMHSKDMNANNFFEHVSSNGKTTADRLTSVGYRWISLAENLGSGQANEQAVVNAWIASESHCKNIMSPALKEMGAAKEGKYWTQDFGAR